MTPRFKPINKNNIIFVAGGSGMVGSAIIRQLESKNYKKILSPSRKELDLRNQQAVNEYIREHQPDYIYVCAGKVGGIKANSEHLGEFYYENI